MPTVVSANQERFRCFSWSTSTPSLKAVHIEGFSLGGMIAQQVALDHPDLVQRLILLGTAPRGGEGLTFTELSPEEQADPVAFLLGVFFSPSEASWEELTLPLGMFTLSKRYE
jgi:pimeloyl-ACP methyl ester carboxylesterase